MSSYLKKGVQSFGEAEAVTDDTAMTSGGSTPPWVGVTFHGNNTLATFKLDGEGANGTYLGGTTVYGEITGITGDGADYTLYKAKIDH